MTCPRCSTRLRQACHGRGPRFERLGSKWPLTLNAIRLPPPPPRHQFRRWGDLGGATPFRPRPESTSAAEKGAVPAFTYGTSARPAGRSQTAPAGTGVLIGKKSAGEGGASGHRLRHYGTPSFRPAIPPESTSAGVAGSSLTGPAPARLTDPNPLRRGRGLGRRKWVGVESDGRAPGFALPDSRPFG
jgi:hypothetical protein